MRRRLPWVAAICALMLGATGFAVVHATSLPVAPAQLSAASLAHPCPGAATVTNGTVEETWWGGLTSGSVRVTVPAGCAGRTLQVRLYTLGYWGETNVRTGSATVAASGATTVPMSSDYDPEVTWTVRANVDGWDLPTSAWSYTAPPPPVAPTGICRIIDGSGATCTAEVSFATRGSEDYYDIVVRTPSTSYVEWEVTLDFSTGTYPMPETLGNSDLDGYNDGATQWARTNQDYLPHNDVVGGTSCADLPLLTARGGNFFAANRQENNFRYVRNDRERRFSLVIDTGQAGYQDVLDC